ncbi:hypothetical protein AB0F43_31810 [Kribbella sp. NPDC023972]|uniref:hypothetical protein n=1 Tax=Kribbella sp. NPDC023972 TaxID=3154795 RepID=UPI0033F5D8D7
MDEIRRAPVASSSECLICGALDDLTVEHIVPQTLWNRFGIDPDREDLARFRTALCYPHNKATSVLHERTEMMELIETGDPVTRKTLLHLGDWAVWVTLLLGLARGTGVLGTDASRTMLFRRFDTDQAGTPKGVRVYAARVTEYVEPAEPHVPSYALALRGDSRVLLDQAGKPCGFSVREGPINASESIGLGKVVLLVVGETYSSGPDHLIRLDQAAARVGLQRILPLSNSLPALKPTTISMTAVSKLFTVVPLGADLSLMPRAIQELASP